MPSGGRKRCHSYTRKDKTFLNYRELMSLLLQCRSQVRGNHKQNLPVQISKSYFPSQWVQRFEFVSG